MLRLADHTWFGAAGEALAFLAPSEQEAMLAALQAKKVPLTRRAFASDRIKSIAPALTSLMAKSDELKATAQAAFVSYVRSIFLHPNKAVFDVAQLDLEAFADSFGLPTMPHVRMVNKLQKQAGRQAAKARGTLPAAGDGGSGRGIREGELADSASAKPHAAQLRSSADAESDQDALALQGDSSGERALPAHASALEHTDSDEAGLASDVANSDVDSEELLHVKKTLPSGAAHAARPDEASANVDRCVLLLNFRLSVLMRQWHDGGIVTEYTAALGGCAVQHR